MKLTDMNNSAIGSMYRANKIYDQALGNKGTGTIISVPHNGKNVRIQAKPIAPVAAYDAWLKSRNAQRYSGPHTQSATGAQIRRVVIMRRQGSTWKECGEAIGKSRQSAQSLVEFLPLDLAV